MSKVAVKDYEEEALFTGNRGRSTRNDRWRRREEDDEEERHSQQGGAERRHGRRSEIHQPRRFDGICYNYGKKGHIARYCRSENKPVESHAVITSGTFSDEEEWDMEALAILSDGELEFQASSVIEEEDWDFEDSILMITEDEWDISVTGETWGEVKGGIKLELLETEDETNEQLVEPPEMQEDDVESEEIEISEIEADQEVTKLKQLEKILESGEESEKSQAHRSSKTRKKSIAGEEEFSEVDSSEELCQGMPHPEELSGSKLRE